MGGCAVLAVALATHALVGLKMGMTAPLESDAHYYLQAAASLAGGQGYRIPDTFWPDAPAMSRSPGWPFAMSLALRALPAATPDAVGRGLCLLVNALAALAVFLLARRLFDGLGVALLAGLGYAVHPVGLYLAYDGDSEPLFVLLLLGGVLLLLGRAENDVDAVIETSGSSAATGPRSDGSGEGNIEQRTSNAQHRTGRLSRRSTFSIRCWMFDVQASQTECRMSGVASTLSGYSLLGLACLVRPNFLFWIAFVAALLAIRRWKRVAPEPGLRLAGVLIGACLFLAPSLWWAARNHRVTGHFPVLSTLRGQTLYGGNNEVVANDFKYWGYWVFPNAIPGEKPMAELAQTMTEHEVDAYYYRKGVQYVREHLGSMPWLWLGKLVRAYVPIPWKVTVESGLASAYRWCLYLAAAMGLFLLWKTVDGVYRLILCAMLLTNAATILMFWGCARFSFPLDPFLLPFAAAAVLRVRLIRTPLRPGVQL